MMKQERSERLLDVLELLDTDLIEESSFPETIVRKRRKGVIFLLAAVLVLTFSMIGTAAQQHEWAVDIMNIMGLSHADTTQLESGMVWIDKEDVQMVRNALTGKEEEIRFAAESSVGDQRNACIHITTNIKVPATYDEETDYIFANLWEYQVREKQDGPPTMSGAWLEGKVEDGYVSFYMNVSDASRLNVSYVNVRIGDISIGHCAAEDDTINAEDELLYQGEWSLSWKYSYKTKTKTIKVSRDIPTPNGSCKVQRITITPLEVSADCRLSFLHRNLGTEELDITSVKLKDGTEIVLDEATGGHTKGTSWKYFWPEYTLSVYETMGSYGIVLDPDEVVSVKIGTVEIP